MQNFMCLDQGYVIGRSLSNVGKSLLGILNLYEFLYLLFNSSTFYSIPVPSILSACSRLLLTSNLGLIIYH